MTGVPQDEYPVRLGKSAEAVGVALLLAFTEDCEPEFEPLTLALALRLPLLPLAESWATVYWIKDSRVNAFASWMYIACRLDGCWVRKVYGSCGAKRTDKRAKNDVEVVAVVVVAIDNNV